MSNLFGNIFDFDGDGRTSDSEELFGLGLAGPESDPFHAMDCGDEVEFYEEHMDDFDSFEDAEEYFNEHQ